VTAGPVGGDGYREVGLAEGVAMARAGYLVIDVREPNEWDAGHVAGATLVPLGEIEQRMDAVAPDRDTPLLLHCAVGARSARAASWLAHQGYTNVVNLAAPISGWQAAGGAWEEPQPLLSPSQQRRYARQVLVPGVGHDGQRRLIDARVLLVGVGGLGSPVALYLAASGVGTIGLVDDDVVEESNLQRQVLHGADRLGMPKVDSAEMTIRGLNPETDVVKHGERLGPDNVERLIGGYDVIVDGTDSLDTRYVLNDAAVRLRRPVVHGSVYRWDGQITTFVPFEGPCYRCLHPTAPPPELAPACSDAGVLGVLPGIVGLLQANEVIKLILGVGDTLAGRLLMVDARGTAFDELRIRRDPACPACGDGASTTPDRLILPAGLAEVLLDHARRELPNEACGLLAGSLGEGRATTFHPARNAEASPLRYDVHPDDLVRIVLGIEERGEDLVGIFHSHVRSRAVPSATDLRTAHYPGVVHVLASLAKPVTSAHEALRAWRIDDGVSREVELQLG
jgi:molybdopterin/thiamine biosynthesis adenylyltransferase/rhodanese-related sulfurtransferase/proteasome lid subunit RPN8/RPN11